MNFPERGPIISYATKVTFFTFGPMSLLDGKSYRLKGELEKFPSVTEELRRIWQEEAKGFPQLSSMNMSLLALAFVVLRNMGDVDLNDPSSIPLLRQQLDHYVDVEYDPNNEKTATLGLRKKENLFRYMDVIYRNRNPQE